MPITPSDGWKPADSGYPTARILVLLSVCVGLPYFVLASTGPLVQAWFSRTFPGRSPYRLYSLSNFGSLLALLSYPFVVEPALDGNAQSLWWTAGFALFCLLCGTACWLTARLSRAADATAGAAAAAAANVAAPAIGQTSPSWQRRLLWLALPAFASILLMATTNHVCQDMPPVPFLWVVPLSLYLLSFIIAFDHERWYRRLPYGLVALVAVYLAAGMYNPAAWGAGWLGDVHGWIWGTPPSPWIPTFGYQTIIICQFVGLFALCMLCHGELVRLRPEPRYLTELLSDDFGGRSVGRLVGQPHRTAGVQHLCGMEDRSGGRFRAGRDRGLPAGRVDRPGVAWAAATLWPSCGVLRTGGLLAALLALVEIIQLIGSSGLPNASILEQTRNFYGS